MGKSVNAILCGIIMALYLGGCARVPSLVQVPMDGSVFCKDFEVKPFIPSSY